MDAKITLSFDKSVINAAKKFADSHHISLSRLTEFLYKRITAENYYTIEELPISDWVTTISEGETGYQRSPASRKAMKKEYFERKK